MKQNYLNRWGLLMILAFILLIPVLGFSQTTISGRVVDDNGQAVAGATVTIPGTTSGAGSLSDGKYKFEAPAAATEISVSAIGYLKQTVLINGRTAISFVLKSNVSNLNEIVVTGYTAQRKKDITGSVAIVDVSSLKSVPAGNTASLLQGQASGVTVTNSGQPGAATSVNIRGIGSIFSTEPLVIIDGTPGKLDNINPNEIESMQVLKDAGSAAIYGVRGSNGVIVVTTKKGKQGKAVITYDGLYGATQPLKNGFNLANTNTYMQAEYLSYKNDNLYNGAAMPKSAQFDPTGSGTWSVPDFISPAGAHTGDAGTTMSSYTLNPQTGVGNQITMANKQGTDWFHQVFRSAPLVSHNITASGGSDKSTYLMSVGYLNQQGTLMSTYEKRYSLRANTAFNLSNHIRVGENAYMFYKNNPQVQNQNEGNVISFIYREPPIIPVYDIAGNYAGSRSNGLSNSQNPYANAMRNNANAKLQGNSADWQMTGNVFAEADILKHLTVRTQFGGTFDNYYNRYFGYTAYENAEGNTNANSYTEGGGYNSSYTWTNTLRYDQTFGKHNVKLLLGNEAITNYGRQVQGSNGNYLITTNPDYVDLDTGAPAGQLNSNNRGIYSNGILSYFGRLDYSFNDKYLLSATVRRDGSSYFATGRQYGTFPSVTLGWRLSQESFLKNVSWINDLKLRAGFGTLGSLSGVSTQPNNAFNLYGATGGNSYYDINGTGNSTAIGAYASQLGNKQTSWEIDKELNVGVDASLFNHLDFSLEYYKKSVTGLLFRPQVLAQQTFASPAFINAGDIENKGIDFNLNYHANVNDFHFNVGMNVSHYTNMVKSLDASHKYLDESSSGSTRLANFTRLQPGQPMGEFFGYQSEGLYKDAADVASSPAYAGARPGFLKFKDVNGDGKIDANDRTFIGNPNPKLTGGLSLNASYKGFDMTAFFYGVYGNKVANYTKYWTDFPQVFDGNVSANVIANSWKPGADNSHATIPVLSRQATLGNTGSFNSWYLEDGSFLKLKSLQIGYSLPASVLSHVGISKFRVYVLANNLFTLTKYTGLDPELQNSSISNNTSFGIDFGNYPANEKRYSVGVQVTF